MRCLTWFLCLSSLTFVVACSKDENTADQKAANGSGDSGPSAEAGTGSAEKCDESKRPILFVHGIMGGGDNFELQAQRFTSNGYCRKAIRAFDYDGTGLAFGGLPMSEMDATQARLDAFVDKFREDSGFDTIDLVGHSFGTAQSATYLATPDHAAKIEHYAQAAGGGLPEPVSQVNLSSDGDFVAGNPKKVAAMGPMGTPVENPDIGYHDHVAVLTCKEAFSAMYELFNGEPPAHPDVVAEEHPQVSGFYKNFSDNTPHAGIKLEIYEVAAATGKRIHEKPDFTFTTEDDGHWGPFAAKPDAHYEFFAPEAGEPPKGGTLGRPQHTYRGPFKHSTHLMYLKALPIIGTFAANIIVGNIPYNDDQTGFILQNSNRAMISKDDPSGHGSDSLTVNGTELLSAEVAPEKLQLVALFAFDNMQPVGSVVSAVTSAFFLSAVDVNLPTSETTPVKVALNGVTVNVPRWKSDTEGSSLVLFDN